MADDRPPISLQSLQQVLDRLDEVMIEAERLRKEVVRQLANQRERDRQHLGTKKKKR